MEKSDSTSDLRYWPRRPKPQVVLVNEAGVGTDWNVTSGDCKGQELLLVNPKNSYAQETEEIDNKIFYLKDNNNNHYCVTQWHELTISRMVK